MFGALLQGAGLAPGQTLNHHLHLKKISNPAAFFSLNLPSFVMFEPLNSFAVAKSLFGLSFPFFDFIFQSSYDREMSVIPRNDNVQIREVWDDNLIQEFALIREIVDDFPFVAMDTEFPGIVCRPVGNFKSAFDYQYAMLKANVDMLKLIQLGLTFADERGNLPTCNTGYGCVWQFNFRDFDVDRDMCAADSIELLRQCGINFKKNRERGIDPLRFGELFMSSGIVLNEDVHWVTFHSSYDFGYLLKILICKELPDTREGFFQLMNIYFPTLYDIKHLIKFCNNLYGGLSKIAEMLGVQRVGVSHQAGSDSLLTSCTFRKLCDSYFINGLTEKHAGVLHGLAVDNAHKTITK